jgi:hypothetical protein
MTKEQTIILYNKSIFPFANLSSKNDTQCAKHCYNLQAGLDSILTKLSLEVRNRQVNLGLRVFSIIKNTKYDSL